MFDSILLQHFGNTQYLGNFIIIISHTEDTVCASGTEVSCGLNL